MKKYIIHPLSQHIIRRNSLRGFEDEINLDKLHTDLRFKSTKEKREGVDMETVLQDARGTYGVPQAGWVVVETDAVKMEDIWEEAMGKLKRKDFI